MLVCTISVRWVLYIGLLYNVVYRSCVLSKVLRTRGSFRQVCSIQCSTSCCFWRSFLEVVILPIVVRAGVLYLPLWGIFGLLFAVPFVSLLCCWLPCFHLFPFNRNLLYVVDVRLLAQHVVLRRFVGEVAIMLHPLFMGKYSLSRYIAPFYCRNSGFAGWLLLAMAAPVLYLCCFAVYLRL